MDSDIEKILAAAGVMASAFARLEGRGVRSFDDAGSSPAARAAELYKAIASAANTFRWFEGIELSLLRAAFDDEYADEIRKANKMAKQGKRK